MLCWKRTMPPACMLQTHSSSPSADPCDRPLYGPSPDMLRVLLITQSNIPYSCCCQPSDNVTEPSTVMRDTDDKLSPAVVLAGSPERRRQLLVEHSRRAVAVAALVQAAFAVHLPPEALHGIGTSIAPPGFEEAAHGASDGKHTFLPAYMSLLEPNQIPVWSSRKLHKVTCVESGARLTMLIGSTQSIFMQTLLLPVSERMRIVLWCSFASCLMIVGMLQA